MQLQLETEDLRSEDQDLIQHLTQLLLWAAAAEDLVKEALQLLMEVQVEEAEQQLKEILVVELVMEIMVAEEQAAAEEQELQALVKMEE
jgi:hypothetical protein